MNPDPPEHDPLPEGEARVHQLEIGPEFEDDAGAAPPRRPPDWMTAMLSAEERARHARLRVPRPRAEFLAGKVLTRVALGRATGGDPRALEFEIGERGKPRPAVRAAWAESHGASSAGIATPGTLDFSLSHTRGIALLAIARGATVGCDVEFDEGDPEVLRLAGRYFAESERQWITGLPRGRALEAFYRLWTLKESWLKAIGAGMAISLQSFGFAPETIEDERPRLEFGDADPGAWTFLVGRADERRPWSVALRPANSSGRFATRIVRVRADANGASIG